MYNKAFLPSVRSKSNTNREESPLSAGSCRSVPMPLTVPVATVSWHSVRSANALEIDVENSFKCGMNGHISKPIEPDEVYRCLNKWLLGDVQEEKA